LAVPPKSALTSVAKIAAGGTQREARGAKAAGVRGESGRRDVSKRRRVLLGKGAQVDAHFLDELRDRRDPSPGACAIGAETASEISNEIGAAEERADERGEDRGGWDAHPPRRLQTFAKLVAFAPCRASPRLAYAVGQ
jgi:hypothetical protein